MDVGCGAPDTDSDGDTVADCVDSCPDDFDGDGYHRTGDCPPGTPPDCNDIDDDVHPGAPEINDGQDNQCPDDDGYGAVDETSGNSGFHHPDDKTLYSWPPQAGATTYQVARATSTNFAGECKLFCASPAPFLDDDEEPDPGALFAYLNRAVLPNVGSWGLSSNGIERTVSCK